ncbi:hypothetical protein EJB05_31243 [Eragrostis curvula]|uniref:DNA/RNA-binding protein Alba-like domain-containing protein n=1 Tax=Eragrostis curvula TaxID=38414 RepID=A0A5J9UD18_9POAL|nr:hypothetical protein EJB05_31243 [Eragrostis curvula]
MSVHRADRRAARRRPYTGLAVEQHCRHPCAGLPSSSRIPTRSGDCGLREGGEDRGVVAEKTSKKLSGCRTRLLLVVDKLNAKRLVNERVAFNVYKNVAISTVVTVAEILKNNGFAVEKKIRTSTVEINDESRGRPFQKAKIEIVLGKSEQFDELMAAAAEEKEAEDGIVPFA